MKKPPVSTHIETWSPRTNESRLVVFLGTPQETHCEAVHYVWEKHQSFPCHGDKLCRWHDYPINLKYYAPGAISGSSFHCPPETRPRLATDSILGGWWTRRVIEISEGASLFLANLLPGDVYWAARPGGEMKQRPLFKKMDWRLPLEVENDSFLVLPHLRRMWIRVVGKGGASDQTGSDDFTGTEAGPSLFIAPGRPENLKRPKRHA